MKIQSLKTCLEHCNDEAFKRLEAEHDLSWFLSGKTLAAREYTEARGGSLVHRARSVGDFAGWNRASRITRANLEPWIDFPATGSGKRRVAVGAVIDGQEDTSTSDDRPVVLTVDMNHNWRHRRDGDHTTIPDLFAYTGLRSAAAAAVKKLRQPNGSMHELDPEGCHLVAAGFFPWTTTRPWVDITRDAYGEELLGRYFGWHNPLEFVVELIRALHTACRDLDWRDGLTHIIFHGSSGAVTRAGLAAAGQLTRDPQRPGATLPLHRSDRPMGDRTHPAVDGGAAVVRVDSLPGGEIVEVQAIRL